MSQARDGGVLSLCGPTDLEHQFAATLSPGESFQSVPVAIAIGRDGLSDAVAELTAYRRWLRSESGGLDDLPVVYNDFMNTLMGQPSTEALMPLITAAAEAGVDCFCIDAGWFADPSLGDWWATVGEWREADRRFSSGFRCLIDTIHDSGMRSGIWLEPEVVGVESRIAQSLPEAAFFRRYGQRVREHDRYQLDFRHHAARAHLDAVVDRLVSYGISYFKLDYNINIGAGTDWGVAGSGAGLLAHTRAFTDWIAGIRARHPHVSIENCSSGAMRADYGLLAVTQLQSTSDQQDFRLYPPVAASAPATILPEQSGNWAYPAKDMSVKETIFTLVTGLSGRFYLSGFLNELDADARELTAQAVRFAHGQREWLTRVTPFWPDGFPSWDDSVVCLGLTDGDISRLFVWNRGAAPARLVLSDHSNAAVAFPPGAPAGDDAWTATASEEGLVIEIPTGPTARVFEL
ncbi:glycoside hydrolase family 36 protein [Leifsonia aquatica]|uniref:glycoside hydrolase family 36 protein n=1 Tax=Leifsonia aquatica TaxID=144185 RepID=UPI00069454AC|nr:glycoside hydrolase family 36 protein [Leifsonia aquatica]